jgi:hypothetical protein
MVKAVSLPFFRPMVLADAAMLPNTANIQAQFQSFVLVTVF